MAQFLRLIQETVFVADSGGADTDIKAHLGVAGSVFKSNLEEAGSFF